MDYILLTIFLGLINTIIVHLAKGMQKHGIGVFDQLRTRSHTEKSQKEGIVDKKNSFIYIVGIILNQFPMLWGTLAGKFGKAPYYTSMFPLGLIVLILYTRKILHEPIQKQEYFGFGFIILGILLIGIENIPRPSYVSPINISLAFTIIVIFILVNGVFLIVAHHKNNPIFTGIIFGLYSGGFGGLDPVMKNIGQQLGDNSGFFPNSSLGWVIYLGSFLIGALAIIFTQWGFARNARASILVPFSNISYVIIPIFIYFCSLPGFSIGWFTLCGLGLTIMGIFILGKSYGRLQNTIVTLPADKII